jgi:hypothetical protein
MRERGEREERDERERRERGEREERERRERGEREEREVAERSVKKTYWPLKSIEKTFLVGGSVERLRN